VHGGAGVNWCCLAAASKGPRNIADEPGRLYLNNVCPKTEAFAVCSYRDRDFKITDDFLWTGSPTIGMYSTLEACHRKRRPLGT